METLDETLHTCIKESGIGKLLVVSKDTTALILERHNYYEDLKDILSLKLHEPTDDREFISFIVSYYIKLGYTGIQCRKTHSRCLFIPLGKEYCSHAVVDIKNSLNNVVCVEIYYNSKKAIFMLRHR